VEETSRKEERARRTKSAYERFGPSKSERLENQKKEKRKEEEGKKRRREGKKREK